MKLAFFDLDGTLLDGTTEGLWAALLARQGLLDFGPFHGFRQDYLDGRLDIAAYNAWQNAPYRNLEVARLLELRDQLLHTEILPRIPTAARTLIAGERESASQLVLATAASDFLAGPIAKALGFDALLATQLEWRDGRPSGAVVGEPCYQEGKLRRAQQHLVHLGLDADALERASFHSDSFNDLPLLERVGQPVVVDPDDRLAAIAKARQWPVLWIHRDLPA